MILFFWAVIAAAVLLSVVLVYLEHEWGFVLGGTTAAVLAVSYFSADLLMRSPLIVVMPQGSRSHFDVMAVAAAVLLVAALIVIAFLAGRSSASEDKRQSR